MDTLFDSVAGILVTQSCQLMVVFVIAVAGSWILRNQSAHWRYLLWLLVIGKCLTPSMLSLPLAVLPADSVAPVAVPTVNVSSNFVEGEKPKTEPSVIHESPALIVNSPAEHSLPGSNVLQSHTVVRPQNSASAVSLAPATTTKFSSWLILAWVVGVTVFLTVLFGKMLETQYRLRRARFTADDKTQSTVNSIAKSMSRLRPPNVYFIESSSQPFVFGWLRGSIYLPACFEKIEAADQQNAILTHELAHVARWDAAVNFVQMIVQAIFFFHPAIWWANRKIREEREKCCDEVVLADPKTLPKNYCEAIVKMLDRKGPSEQFQPVLAVGGSAKNIEERILTILAPNRKFLRRPSLAAITILCFLAAIVLPSAIVVTQATISTATSETQDPKQEPADLGIDSDWEPGQELEFQVIDAETKKPLAGVDLELQYQGKGIDFSDVKVQTTDAEGKSIIKFPNTPLKSVRVYPSKPGYVPLRVYWASEPTPVLPKTVTIPLSPGKTIGGTIRDNQGNPVAGAKVRMHYWGESEGLGQGESPDVRVNICDTNYNCKGIATSDSNGRWKLDVLPEEIDFDKIHLYFNHKDFISDHAIRAVTSHPVYECSSLEELCGLTAVTTMQKGKTIEGVVTTEDGKPISQARIYGFEGYRFDEPLATTAMDGAFKLMLRKSEEGLSEEWTRFGYEEEEAGIFLIEAEGYAPELIELKNEESLKVKLKPGKTLRGRVVDEAGNPINGADVWAQSWRGQRSRLRIRAKTDADGNFEVSNAPADAIEFSIYKQGMMLIDQATMTAGKKEYSFTMTKPLIVTATVTDADTGEPINNVSYVMGYEYNDGRAPDWQPYPRKTVQTGKSFEEEIRQFGFAKRIRVEADGYFPGISEAIEAKKDSAERSLKIEFKLKKGKPLVGYAVRADGKPLVGATVILGRSRVNIENRHEKFHDNQNPVTTTDESGKYQFPPEVEPYCMVVIHKDGVGMITEKEMDPANPIQIEPWDDDNKQMQIIRLPSEGVHYDFPPK